MFFIYSDFRPFERTIVLQKDSSGYVGFVFKNGKITQIAKDTSAARFVCLLWSPGGGLPYETDGDARRLA